MKICFLALDTLREIAEVGFASSLIMSDQGLIETLMRILQQDIESDMYLLKPVLDLFLSIAHS